LRMIKTDVYSLPNILARARQPGEAPLVPELMQDACTVKNLAAATLELFRDSPRRARIVESFEQMHRDLRGDLQGSAAARAAAAVIELMDATHAPP
ncbi:MAG: lipid-A-disaccharide synthase, partial [Rhodanobacter sp.]